MAFVIWGALAAVVSTVLRQIWIGIGPPWRWPALACTALRRQWRERLRRWDARRKRKRGCPDPDPFEILDLQRRLGALAQELQRLESDGADDKYWARAHRIHTRKAAYDQLLIVSCRLAGVPGTPAGPAIPTQLGRRTDAERFRDEMELAARGWSW
jgi:hypothetical protein